TIEDREVRIEPKIVSARPSSLNLRFVPVSAANELVGHDVPDHSFRLESPIQFVRSVERAGFQVEELHTGLRNPAKAQVDHRRPVDRLNGARYRLVRPRATRNDQHVVKVPAEHLDRRAMMPPRRVKTASVNGEFSAHVRFDGWKAWVVR